MEDQQILGDIGRLVDEEHALRARHAALDDSDRVRLAEVERQLDQCWDLLRQRRALETVDPRAPAWNWSLAPKAAGFWHRRMAQETAVHRWDAESAYGNALPVERLLAVDGIDEALRVFLPAGRAEEPVEGAHGSVH